MEFHQVSIALAVALTSIIAYPLAIHLWLGWKRKADDVILSMSPESAKMYLSTFQDIKAVELKDALKEFRKFYHSWYGRKYLIFLVFIAVFAALIISYLMSDTVLYSLQDINGIKVDRSKYIGLPPTGIAAAAGAYGFAAWGIIWRTARLSLSVLDILGVTIRLAIAIPLGYAFASLSKDFAPFIAFAVGAFPLETVETILQRLANKHLGVEMGASASKDQVTELSCVDREIADRLQDADITTVCQLAYCDPVQTCMRTNLSFAFTSDICAQALAWIYLGDKLTEFRVLGLRGAVEFYSLCEGLESKDDDIRIMANAILKKAANVVSVSPEEFHKVATEIGYDPYTIFLAETWPELREAEQAAESVAIAPAEPVTTAELSG